MLGSNEQVNIENLEYPLLASKKYEGIRGEFIKGELLSREFKSVSSENIQSHEVVVKLKEYSKKHNIIIEGELYIPSLPIGEHVLFINSKKIDGKFMNKIKSKLKEGGLTHPYNYYMRLPKEFEIRLFDCFYSEKETVLTRMNRLVEIANIVGAKVVEHKICYNPLEVQNYLDESLEEGLEGLVLKKIDGFYKFGRSTLKEQLFLKIKPYLEFEGKVIEITERTKNMTESTINALGYKEKRDIAENKVTTGIAATVITKFSAYTVGVNLNGSEEYRREVFEKKESFIGREFLYSGMLYKAKNVPRIPKFIRWL